MTQIDLAQTLRNELLDILTETFEEVKGMYLDANTSLFDTLATISAEEASRPVSASCATLAAQVEHVRFFIDVLDQCMRNQRSEENVDWGEIWRTVGAVTPDEWAESIHDLRASYERTKAFIESIADWDGDRVSGAVQIIVHSAYHLGEIRQALCTIRER